MANKRKRRKSVFKVIKRKIDMYLYQKKLNKKSKHFEPIWKKGTELFFKELTDNETWYCEKSFTPIDIEYLDGYFIFDMGSSSVVHFKIKECPGWKFAIWWGDAEIKPFKDAKFREIKGTFFAQYEMDIDKFKPSYSTIKCTFSLIKTAGGEFRIDDREFKLFINFIATEPELAWYRDHYYEDYNCKYVSRTIARNKMKKHLEKERRREQANKEIIEKSLNFIIDNVAPLFEDLLVIDRGSHVSPRYDMRTSTNNIEWDGETYFLKDFDAYKDDPEVVELQNKYKQFQKSIDEEYGDITYTWLPFDLHVDCIFESRFKKLVQDVKGNGFPLFDNSIAYYKAKTETEEIK